MNKRFSTLLAAALVACGLSANATDGVYLGTGDLKTGDFVFLSSAVTAGNDLSVTVDGTLKLHKDITSVTDSTIAVLDSMAWRVEKVAGTVPTFKFQNRATGHYLSVKALGGQGAASSEVATGIDTWAIGDKGLYATKGDSAYCVAVSNVQVVSAKGATSSTESFVPRKMNNVITLNADDFNQYIKGFNFAAVNGRKDPATTTTGETNLLTSKTWVASKASEWGTDTLFFQVKDSKAKENYLSVDTAFMAGTDQAAAAGKGTYILKTDSLKQGSDATAWGTSTGLRIAKSDSLYMFQVKYTYGNDSLSIAPIALPVYSSSASSEAETLGSNWTVGDSLSMHNLAASSAAPVIGLKKLSTTVALGIDAKFSGVSNNAYLVGFSEANILASGRSTAIGGDAEITAGIYFIKDMNKEKGGAANANYGKYKVLDLANVDAYQESKGSVAIPSSQWAVVAGSAKGIYKIVNRESNAQLASGSFNAVKDAAGKVVANTFVCAGDTLFLEDAKITEKTIKIGTKNYVTTGYGYFDEASLPNKRFKVASASPYLNALFMQPKAKADSSLVLDETEYSFYLKLPKKDGNLKKGGAIGVQEANIDTLYRQSYILVTSKDEWVTPTTDGYALTKDASKDTAVFYLKSWGAATTYALIDTTNSYTSAGLQKVGINAQSTAPAVIKLAANTKNTDLFTVTELDAPSMLFTMPVHQNIYNNNDRLAIGKNNLAVMAQPGNDLKADADKFVNDNFTLWFDTVNYVADQTATYFISQGIKAVAGEETKAEEASAERMYLTVASQDSINKSADLKDLYTLQNANRLYFRTAARHGVDTLIVNNFDEEAGVMAPDTVAAKANGTKHSDDAAKGLLLGGIENFKFQFIAIDGTDNYQMKSLKDNKYVVSINGLLVVKTNSDENMVATLKAPDYATSNEAIATSEVTVIAGEGQVTIAGAAGKKVVISNILGQVVANTVLTSDNAAIAAPQGVVVVAVEGEEAVKAIVK
ncbi:DUF6383 domain-containing protein [Parabacteroides sp.]